MLREVMNMLKAIINYYKKLNVYQWINIIGSIFIIESRHLIDDISTRVLVLALEMAVFCIFYYFYYDKIYQIDYTDPKSKESNILNIKLIFIVSVVLLVCFFDEDINSLPILYKYIITTVFSLMMIVIGSIATKTPRGKTNDYLTKTLYNNPDVKVKYERVFGYYSIFIAILNVIIAPFFKNLYTYNVVILFLWIFGPIIVLSIYMKYIKKTGDKNEK